MLKRLGLEHGEAIIHPWINKAIEKAQEKVEARNFDIRKNLLQFDDVMNDQRKVIFDQRREVMSSDDISELINDMRKDTIEDLVSRSMPEKAMSQQWDAKLIHEEALKFLALDITFNDWFAEEGIANQEVYDRLFKLSEEKMEKKRNTVGPEIMRRVEKSLVLQMIDTGWRDHLQQLDFLRGSIQLRAYAQKQPLLEYQKESFLMFQEMLESLRGRVTEILSKVEIRAEPSEADLKPSSLSGIQLQASQEAERRKRVDEVKLQRSMPRIQPNERDPSDSSTWGKVARNEICPCGSGKKFKKCHGKSGMVERGKGSSVG
jgi:preprotein translocase subunit SecA